jgi:hypothetical protein
MLETWAPPPDPFTVTKAVDFTDEEILLTWVDLPSPGGFRAYVDPRTPVPVFLLGGKGSGRTHLMRYYSSSVQELLKVGNALEAFSEAGYIGVYLRCSGLNSGRFHGKGIDQQIWRDVFAYYFDIWLLQLALDTLSSVFDVSVAAPARVRFLSDVSNLFDVRDLNSDSSISGLLDTLHALQREVDIAVNNAALTKSLNVVIRATRGRLVFGLGNALQRAVPALKKVQLLYLIDEFENLDLDQQRYVNTLVREKEAPISFIVGSRLYGFRTRETYSAGEVNREGSEFEAVYLDRRYQAEPKTYDRFCRLLVARRLRESALVQESESTLLPNLDRYFETHDSDPLGVAETAYIFDRDQEERPWLKALRDRLIESIPRKLAPGVESQADVNNVLQSIHCPEYPLIEKLNVYLLFKDWAARKRDLTHSAHTIAKGSARLIAGSSSPRHESTLKLFRADLLAQVLRETGRKQRYLGLDTFIHMSSGMPRNLLIILKHIFRWGTFSGERPFANGAISEATQREGVLQASTWYFEDAPGPGQLGQDAGDAIGRLASFFRVLRFTDKPVESSLVTFSVDLATVSDPARAVIEAAEQRSLLLPVASGQRERNSGAVHSKFQLNPMLAPRWDLPISRRGTTPLAPSEGNAIFDPAYKDEFSAMVRRRTARMNAPFYPLRVDDDERSQEPLF